MTDQHSAMGYRIERMVTCNLTEEKRMEDMRETEVTTGVVLERMENTLCSMEQMFFDSINITDKLVTLVSEAREYAGMISAGTEEERQEALQAINNILKEVLQAAFQVNNISHELEQQALYQRETSDTIRQIVEFLYAMTDA